MKKYFFAIIIFTTNVFFLSSCTSSTEQNEIKLDSNDSFTAHEIIEILPTPETHTLTSDELEFIYVLNEIGLNWSISSRQSRLPSPSPYYDYRSYITICPSSLVSSLITIRNDLGGIFGEKNIRIYIRPYRQPTEYEFIRLQQEGLLTENEWLLFWELAGKLLEKEDCIVSITNRSLEYLKAFSFSDKTENSVTIMEGNSSDIDYSVILSWNTALERYAHYEISLTVGLSEFYREYRKRLEWIQ